MKVKYIGRFKHKYDDGVDLFYEYRGRQYIITDENNGYSETIREKHENEQKRIDSILDAPETNEQSAEIGLEAFFESIGI